MLKEKENVPPLYMPGSRVHNALEVSACESMGRNGENTDLHLGKL